MRYFYEAILGHLCMVLGISSVMGSLLFLFISSQIFLSAAELIFNGQLILLLGIAVWGIGMALCHHVKT